MTPVELFLHADAALREVIDQLDPADFSASVPKEWSQLESPTLLGILGRHAYDEAWIPDVLAGRAAADGDPYAGVDLLGDDPIASYDELNDTATEAVRSGDVAETLRFTYGDYPADEGFAHLATYRAFQAYSIAKHFGIPFHLSPELVVGFNEHVVPHADEWRQWGVFPPAIEPPADADDDTQLLCTLGFWQP
ncbi:MULTISPECIES: hypothetical protein [Microbacterium]|uniref:hypothetical protein n=1 Tax=Microbacterium TaxID=33882 RepID=UPI0027814DCD|nr:MULTISPECIES: hypothetical protein [Microbacterium]MDQ1075037.1 hypothetical protein [Microbacterium sp. SORGH_AS_0969]MDQ1115268.1 hypothetical protein [Microbacterium testaceum]